MLGMSMNIICSICARGGSKGVKNKNLRILEGKPLIAHSILQAKNSRMFVGVAVSSDSQEILDVANEWGADLLVVRPSGLATDEAPKLPAIVHCFTEAERHFSMTFNYAIDLDATSPLRDVDDICQVVSLLTDSGAGNVITGMPARRSPYFNLVELDENNIARLSKPLSNAVTCRQNSPRCFDMNASIYAWRRDVLLNSQTIFNPDTRLYVMPEERSIDIDSEDRKSVV